jgi:hypothetical protein
VILHLTSRAQLESIDCNRTVSLPASLLEDRAPFSDANELAKRIRQNRLRNESTRVVRR